MKNSNRGSRDTLIIQYFKAFWLAQRAVLDIINLVDIPIHEPVSTSVSNALIAEVGSEATKLKQRRRSS
jgi:hypothetical protein